MSLVTRARPLVGALSLAIAALTLVPLPAEADGPGVGTPYVVSVGDSYISGEAGRWAGRPTTAPRAPTRWADGVLRQRLELRRADQPVPPQQERRDPHRRWRRWASTSPAPAPGPRRPTAGATSSPGSTSTTTEPASRVRPRCCSSSPRPTTSRWSRCRSAATTSTSPSIVQPCVTDFLASPSWWKDYCKDDSSVVANFTTANVAAVKTRIANAYAQRPDRDAQRRICRQLAGR